MLLILSSCASVAVREHPTIVGAQSKTVHDAGRDREISFEILYPAADQAAVTAERHVWIYDLPIARDAPAQDEEAHPVLLTSHGTGGSRWDFFWLAEQAVAAGFIVISVEHPGDNWTDRAPLSSLQVWERPRDLSYVLTALLEDPNWGSRIDAEQVVAVGHSVGGFTVLGLAGLRYDIDRAFNECFVERMNDSTCVWVRQSHFDFAQIDYGRSHSELRDERVKGVLAFSPAVAEAADLSSAAAIAVPVRIVGSRRDALTPFELHAKPYATWVPEAELRVLEHGNHYAAITPCNTFGRKFITACQDREGFDRTGAQVLLAREAMEFFERVLRAPDRL